VLKDHETEEEARAQQKGCGAIESSGLYHLVFSFGSLQLKLCMNYKITHFPMGNNFPANFIPFYLITLVILGGGGGGGTR
jgi:hypothetical protein